MDNKVLEEIEKVIIEEQEATLKAEQKAEEVAEYPKYLESNRVTLPLADFMALYESATALGKLVGLLLDASELGYKNEALRVDTFESLKVMDYVKELEPLHYVERYEALLEGAE